MVASIAAGCAGDVSLRGCLCPFPFFSLPCCEIRVSIAKLFYFFVGLGYSHSSLSFFWGGGDLHFFSFLRNHEL